MNMSASKENQGRIWTELPFVHRSCSSTLPENYVLYDSAGEGPIRGSEKIWWWFMIHQWGEAQLKLNLLFSIPGTTHGFQSLGLPAIELLHSTARPRGVRSHRLWSARFGALALEWNDRSVSAFHAYYYYTFGLAPIMIVLFTSSSRLQLVIWWSRLFFRPSSLFPTSTSVLECTSYTSYTLPRVPVIEL